MEAEECRLSFVVNDFWLNVLGVYFCRNIFYFYSGGKFHEMKDLHNMNYSNDTV